MKITLVNCTEWQGLYIDDDLVIQAETLYAADVIRVLRENKVINGTIQMGSEKLERQSSRFGLPDKLSKIKDMEK